MKEDQDTRLETLGDKNGLEVSKIQGTLLRKAQKLILRAETTSEPSLCVEIDGAITLLGNRLKDFYGYLLPELASILSNPITYAFLVLILKDKPQAAFETLETRKSIAQLLGPEATLAVQMCLPKAKELAPEIMTASLELGAALKQLDSARNRIKAAIADSLSEIAPNLLALIGRACATDILAGVGGLDRISQTPAANLLKVSDCALEHSTLVQNVPTRFRRSALRALASKVILAARVDVARTETEGKYGKIWHDKVLKRINALLAPPPLASQRALPVPEDKPAKRRGGRRLRRQRQRLTPSEYKIRQNRTEFGPGDSKK